MWVLLVYLGAVQNERQGWGKEGEPQMWQGCHPQGLLLPGPWVHLADLPTPAEPPGTSHAPSAHRMSVSSVANQLEELALFTGINLANEQDSAPRAARRQHQPRGHVREGEDLAPPGIVPSAVRGLGRSPSCTLNQGSLSSEQQGVHSPGAGRATKSPHQLQFTQ